MILITGLVEQFFAPLVLEQQKNYLKQCKRPPNGHCCFLSMSCLKESIRIHRSLWGCVHLHSLALLQNVAVNVIVWQETRQDQPKKNGPKLRSAKINHKNSCLLDRI